MTRALSVATLWAALATPALAHPHHETGAVLAIGAVVGFAAGAVFAVSAWRRLRR
jgi:hypothetical protein